MGLDFILFIYFKTFCGWFAGDIQRRWSVPDEDKTTDENAKAEAPDKKAASDASAKDAESASHSGNSQAKPSKD